MDVLGRGLSDADHHEDALVVQEVQLSMLRRIGAAEEHILVTQGNIACAYHHLGRAEESLRMRENIYSRTLNLFGEEHKGTLREANNYANCLLNLHRFEEAKALMLQMMPVARRVLGEDDVLTLRLRWNYAQTLFCDDISKMNNDRGLDA